MQPLVPRPAGGHLLYPATSMKAQLGRSLPNGRQCHSRTDHPSLFIVPCYLMGPGWGLASRSKPPWFL